MNSVIRFSLDTSTTLGLRQPTAPNDCLLDTLATMIHAPLEQAIKFRPQEVKWLDTGIQIDVPPTHEAQIFLEESVEKIGISLPRNGQCLNLNYNGQGRLIIQLINTLHTPCELKKCESFARIVIHKRPVHSVSWQELSMVGFDTKKVMENNILFCFPNSDNMLK
jgi:dUTPase